MPCSGCGQQPQGGLPATSGDLSDDDRFVVTLEDGPRTFTTYREAKLFQQENGGRLRAAKR